MKALALFGSQVSGGADESSDKDFLIICSSEKKKTYISHYSKHGYSVSAYTPKQLEYMKIKGSLFLQHLKMESRIIYDENSEFQSFLESCPIVKPSNLEINSCISSLKEAALTPNNTALYGWLADYTYVLSRDYFVKRFAQDGQFIFNAAQLCKTIQVKYKLSESDSNIFLLLREAKNNYRNGSNNLVMHWSLLEKWFEIFNNIIVSKSVCFASRHTEYTYLNRYEKNGFNSSYELLRYIESLRIMFPSIQCDSNSEIIVNKLITRPNNYSSTSKNSRVFLEKYLEDFAIMANKLFKRDVCFASAT
jgi:hypothetical protein